MIILEAMLKALRGEAFSAHDQSLRTTAVKEREDFTEFETGDITFVYCTEFVVNRENTKYPQLLCDFLGTVGDSVVVVDDEDNKDMSIQTDPVTYLRKH